MIVTVWKNAAVRMVAGLVFISILLSFSGCGSKAKKLLDQYEALANDYISATIIAKSNDFVDKLNAKMKEILAIGDSLTDEERARYEDIAAKIQLAAKSKKIDKWLNQFEKVVSEYFEITDRIKGGNFFAMPEGTAKMYELSAVMADVPADPDEFSETQKSRFNVIYQKYQETKLVQD